jgi:hypothetical protein
MTGAPGSASPKGWQSGATVTVTVYIISNSTSGIFSTGTNSEVDAIESAFQRWNAALSSGLTLSFQIVDAMPASPASPYVTVQFGDPGVLGADAYTSANWSSSGYITSSSMTIRPSYGAPIYQLIGHEAGHTYAIDECNSADCDTNVTAMNGSTILTNSRISPSCCDKKLMYSMSAGAYGLSGACSPTFVQGTAYLDTTWDHTTVSATFQHNPEPGNTIIVGCMNINDSGTYSASDNQSSGSNTNTYNKIVSESGQAPVAIYVADHVISTPPFGATAGTFTASCTKTSNSDAINLFAMEFSGLAKTGGVPDATASANYLLAYPAGCSTSLTTTAAQDLIVGLYNNYTVNNPAGVASTSGYSIPSCSGGEGGNCAAQNGSLYEVGAIATGIATSSGSTTIGFSGPVTVWSCAAAALKTIGP